MRVYVDSLPGGSGNWDPGVLHELEAYKGLNLITVKREYNFGLRNNILHGLDDCSEHSDFFICIEDDTVVSSEGIDSIVMLFKSDLGARDNIGAVCATSFSLKSENNSWVPTDRFISWGWATSSSTWQVFRSESSKPSPEQLISQIPHTYSWPEKKFVRRMYVKFDDLDSWAIEFAHWNRLKGNIILRPPANFMQLGLSGPSTHASWAPKLPPASPSRVPPCISDANDVSKKLYSWVRFYRLIIGYLTYLSKFWRKLLLRAP